MTTSNLTEAQADGRACIHCGREDTPMCSAGHVGGVQVFRCVAECRKAEAVSGS